MSLINGYSSKRILILGASGFLGNTLYKELHSYFDVYGTYTHQVGSYKENKAFIKFDAEKDDIQLILDKYKPSIIISAFKTELSSAIRTLEALKTYCTTTKSRLIFLSSYEVFDAKSEFPSYEHDAPLSISSNGKALIKLEKVVRELSNSLFTLVRLPLVLGVNSPKLVQLKQAIKHHAEFEILPHMVVSIISNDRMAQQLHYLINHNLNGIYHLSSEDVIHHEDIFIELAGKISHKPPIFKRVFSSNEDRFLALLSKENKLPKHYRFSAADVISESSLKDEITTLKNSI